MLNCHRPCQRRGTNWTVKSEFAKTEMQNYSWTRRVCFKFEFQVRHSHKNVGQWGQKFYIVTFTFEEVNNFKRVWCSLKKIAWNPRSIKMSIQLLHIFHLNYWVRHKIFFFFTCSYLNFLRLLNLNNAGSQNCTLG